MDDILSDTMFTTAGTGSMHIGKIVSFVSGRAGVLLECFVVFNRCGLRCRCSVCLIIAYCKGM